MGKITPRPIFSLQLQNPLGHTGMLLGFVVGMVPVQNGDKKNFPIPILESNMAAGVRIRVRKISVF